MTDLRRLKWPGVVFSVCALVIAYSPRTFGQRKDKTALVDGREAVEGEVLVKFRRALRAAETSQLHAETDADLDRPVGSIAARRLRSRSFRTQQLLDYFKTHPDVEYVEPNYIVRAVALPNDPAFPQLWALRNVGQTVNGITGTAGADIRASSAWDLTTGSAGNVVAVIDTGVNYAHPDLAANMWSAPAAFSVRLDDIIINCAAGTHGFNAVDGTCDPMDDAGHGTHVSGTIGARGNNGTGVVGVNWTTRIMALKFLDSTGSGSVADAVNAIEFAIQAKAAFAGTAAANVRVLSNSWGGDGFSSTLLDEINKANANDMLFVAAAGNSGQNNDTTPFYPASFTAPNVVAVAATDANDQLSGFSSYGRTSVHLGAPGSNILSTAGSSYGYLSGTSMATPHVSGAAMLVLSRCALTTSQVRAAILDNVDPIGALTVRTTTGGRLNVDRAVRSCGAGTPSTFGKVTPYDNSIGFPVSGTISWQPSSGATGYEYCVDTISNGSCDTSWSPASGLSASLSGLSVATTYYWQVRALNGATTTQADGGVWWKFTTQPTSMAWFGPSWTYRRPVAIGNATGAALTDYNVEVSLDSSFDFSKALPTGSDVRITDASGTLALPFWIESWNPAASRARLWVKVPSVPAGGTTLFLYYGNAAGSTLSNANATFDTYDGFEGLAVGAPPVGAGSLVWTPTGNVTALSSPVRSGSRSLRQRDFTQTSGAFSPLGKGSVTMWLRRDSTASATDDIYLYGSNGALLALAGLGGSGRFHYWDGVDHDTGIAWTTGAWYRVTITFDNASGRFGFAVLDEALAPRFQVANVAFAGSAPSVGSALLYTSSAFIGSAYVDDFRVLKWTGTESTTAIGAEETSGSPPVPGAFSKAAPANGATGQPVTPTLSWAVSSGAASYDYCIDTIANAACDTTWIPVSALSASLSGLAAGTTYSWQVRAVNGSGTTLANGGVWWSFTTASTPPGAFGKTAPANGTSGQSVAPNLAWTASSGATGYEYCVDTVVNAACDTTWTPTSGTGAALSGLTPATTYSWQVRAVNGGGTTVADGGTWWTFTTQSTPSGGWLDPAWLYRRAVTVTNTTGGALSNYLVQVILDSTFDFSHALSDGRDVRVTDGSGTSAVPFWIEGWDATARRAGVWVRIPSLPAGATTIYLYYGNAGASGIGSGATTFDVYDGFEGLAVGVPPGLGSVGLTWSSTSATSVSTPVRQGSRSVRQQDFTSTTATFTAAAKGTVGAWLRRDSTSTGSDDIYLYGASGTLVGLVGLSGSGRFHYWNGTVHDTGVPWTAGGWYLLTATFDAARQQFDVTILDAALAPKVQVAGVPFAGTAPNIGSALLYTSSAYTGSAYVDDFRVLKWTGAEATTTIGSEETSTGTPPPLPSAFGKSAPANGATGLPFTTSLSWNTSSGATSYQYCIDTTANATCDTSWTTTTATSASLSGLAAATTYSWQVRAVNGAGSTQADGGSWWTFTTQSTPSGGWLDPAWLYRRAVTMTNATGGALANYQLQLTLDASFDFTRAASDGRDIRVTDATGTTLVPFWVEAWDATARRAAIWIKMPSVAAGATTIYLYYGNAAAPGIGSGATTLDVYDGFEGLAVGNRPGVGSVGLTWGSTSATAVSTPVRQGSRSVRQQDFTSTTATFTPLAQGTLGAWLRRDGTSTGSDDIYFYGASGTLVGLVGLSGSGRFHYWNGTVHDTGVPWTAGSWYLVTATFDAARQQFDVAIVDAALASKVQVAGVPFAGTAPNIGSALLYTSSAYTGSAYVDDFRVLKWTGAEVTYTISAEQTP